MSLFKWLVIFAFASFILFVGTCLGVIIWTKLNMPIYTENETLRVLEYSKFNIKSESTDNSDLTKDEPGQQRLLGGYKLITRSQWNGCDSKKEVQAATSPAEYVIIAHTATPFCKNTCSKTMRNIQDYHMNSLKMADTKYNFVIGGDSNVYVGLGWDMRLPDNDDVIMISFAGNYVFDSLTPHMIEAARELLYMGVVEKKLVWNYKILAHNHTTSTLSPGKNVYKVIKHWPHFSRELLE